MLVYTKTRVVAPSSLFTVGTATRVILMIFAFLGLTGFLGFCISLNHGLHEGHTLVAPKLLVGLLGLVGLTCGCPRGLTILVIPMAVTSVMHLVGVAGGFATLAKLLTATASLLRDSINQAPRCFPLGLILGIRTNFTSLTLCHELVVLVLNHDLCNIL